MSPDLLEEILVETRPAPDPVWAQRLDEKVERGFERPARPGMKASRFARLRPLLMPAMGAAATVFLVVLIAVNVPGGGGTSAVEPEIAGSAAGQAEESLGRDEAAGAGGGAATGSAERSAGESALAPPVVPGGAVPGERRKVERFASLTLSAPGERISSVGDRVIAVTDRLGGYVASSTVSSSEDDGGGRFELKIPVRRLDQAMAELSKLAHVAERSQATHDITGEFNAARAQVREAKAERQSLLRQLAAADTPNETASIRARLRIVAAELANARRDTRRVNRRANYATVSVTLTADDSAPAPGEDDEGAWTPGDALRDAARVLEVAAGVLIIALAVAVPLGLLAVLGLLVARRMTRRRREAALDAAA